MQYSEGNLSFIQKMALAGVAGAVGGVAGSPADLINVRMQNDIKLPANQRRNYKNAIDGIIRMSKEEGVAKLFNGCTMATGRAILMTIGQLSFYDQIKQMLIKANLAKDNIYTHLFSSFLAASGATVLTQDVLKTRLMNAPPGQFKGLLDCFLYTAKLGPLGFFKGFFPAWVRLAPHTILLFVFFEQFRMRLGYIPEEKLKSIEALYKTFCRCVPMIHLAWLSKYAYMFVIVLVLLQIMRLLMKNRGNKGFIQRNLSIKFM
uniref:Uncharacterized protein n=1 Tax=Meloidogyne enterolobii TaxID=390850 RepID=A0A6V7VQ84_MELEN|nr:unnamed protein product [Meloidogyne enterolobii]